MKSGAKYELFRTAHNLGEVVNPTVGEQAINTKLILRVYGLPVEHVQGLCNLLATEYSSAITVCLTGFDFEKEKGAPLLIFSSVGDAEKVWATRKRDFFVLEHKYQVCFARIQLRRSKHKHAGISFPSWPSKTSLMHKVEAKIKSGIILSGTPLPSMTTRDVLLPGGNLVVAERLVKFLTYPKDLSDIEVCYVFVCLLLTVCVQIEEHFPDVVQIFRWQIKEQQFLALYFPTTEAAASAIAKARELTIRTIHIHAQVYRSPKIGGLYSKIEDVIYYLLRTQYEALIIQKGIACLVCIINVVQVNCIFASWQCGWMRSSLVAMKRVISKLL